MKRNNYCQDQNDSSKRKKINDDNIWGSDDDDEFLVMATQIAEKEVEKYGFLANTTNSANTSILPTYNNFKDTSFKSSTQYNHTQNQDGGFITPQVPNSNQIQELEKKLKKLQTLCESKEGEVTILRSQLKQSKENGFTEMHKREEVFNEKLIKTKKELNKVTSELEFKNLETINLKRKLVDVLKQAESSKYVDNLKIKQKTPSQKLELYSIQHKDYPLRNLPAGIFNKPSKVTRLDSSIQLVKRDGKYNYYTLPISKSDDFERLITKLQPKSTKLESGEVLGIDYIFPEISLLTELDQHSLSLNLATTYIKKILSVTIELLYNLHQDLSGFQDCVQKEHIREFEMQYISKSNENVTADDISIFDAKSWVENEGGIQCRQCIALLAKILPYNKFLYNYFIDSELLNYEENYYKYFTFTKDKRYDYRNGGGLLNLILSVITVIGNLRKSCDFCGFLSSVLYFLKELCLKSQELPVHVYNLISKITQELVFARPNYIVCCDLSSYLKTMALHVPLLESLCKKANYLKRSDKKGMMIISEKTCAFQVYSVLYRNIVLNIESYRTYESHVNFIKFISNASYADWLYCEETRRCDCLLELNKLILKIVSTIMDKILNENDQPQKITDIQKTIVRLSIKVIPKLHRKSLHIIENDIIFIAQYKVLKSKYLELRNKIDFDEYDIETMEKSLLNVDEYLSQTDSKME